MKTAVSKQSLLCRFCRTADEEGGSKILKLFNQLAIFFDQVSHIAHDCSWNRDIDHGLQTRSCVDNVRNAVHDHGHGSDTAFDFRCVGHIDRRYAFDLYIVSGVDADGECGSDLDAMPDMDAIKRILGDGPSKYADSAGKMVEDASRILKNNMRQGSGTSKTGDHGLKYALQGWFETEVSYNFETQQWDFIILTGGFTAGGGMGYEWTWNMQVGPVPLFFQLEAGASGAVQFNAALWEKGNTRANDYLTELRLYAYLQAFGGVGFDYAIIALKLGLYGRVGLTAQLRWLNTAEPVNIGDAYGTEFAGQYLDVDGEVGAKFQVELLFISYEKFLWS